MYVENAGSCLGAGCGDLHGMLKDTNSIAP
jgi:hypothetical protein